MAKREGDERFRLLVQSVKDYAIFMLDPEGNIVTWNDGARRIKGYTADEAIGGHFSMFYRQEDIDRGFPAHELRVAARDGRFEDEGWRLRKDGSRFWANVVITALHADDGTLSGYAKVTRDLTERRRAEEQIAEMRAEVERHRLASEKARDINDGIVQGLVLAKYALERGDGRRSAEAIERTLEEARRIVTELLGSGHVTPGDLRRRTPVEPVEPLDDRA